MAMLKVYLLEIIIIVFLFVEIVCTEGRQPVQCIFKDQTRDTPGGFTQYKHIYITTAGNAYVPTSLTDMCIVPTSKKAISFDVKINKDALVDLVTYLGYASAYYTIVIGGNDNKVVIIRKNGVRQLYEFVDDQLNEKEYRAFWISWLNGDITVGRGRAIREPSTDYATWHDPDPPVITDIFVRTFDPGSFLFIVMKGNVYNQIPGKRSDVQIVKSFIALSLNHCSVKCHAQPMCNSFNYMNSTRMCELLQSMSKDTYTSSEYDFYSEC